MAPELKPVPAFQKRIPTWDTGAAADKMWRLAKENTVTYKNTYTYEKMTIAYHDDIRILRILAGKKSDPLECMLFPRTRGTPPSSKGYDYTALSYWWGDPQENPSYPITLYDDTGDRESKKLKMTMFNSSGRFYVRKNLNDALRQFRDEKEDFNVWVDALCINQENLDEKTAQVSRMDEVYSEAKSVCVWLGAGKQETASTFQFLRAILDLRVLDQMIEQKNPEKWMLVIDMMRNRWFSRRWVIQELALAKSAYVRWGDEVILWSDFADAIALFMTKIGDIKQILRDPALFPKSSDPNGVIGELDPRVLGANALVAATSNLFRKSEDGEVQRKLVSLEVLVSSIFLAFEASEPKDTIYAVLALAKDTATRNTSSHRQAWGTESDSDEEVGVFSKLLRCLWYMLLFKWLWPSGYQRIQDETDDNVLKIDNRVAPDYDKSLADVCADFMEYCIDTSQSLDIMCRHWAPEPRKLTPLEKLDMEKTGRKEVKENMPSWIPSIKGHSYGGPLQILSGRSNGDSFVGSAERPNQRHYNASGGLAPYYKFGKRHIPKKEVEEALKSSKNFPAGWENARQDGSGKQSFQPIPSLKKFDGTLYVRGFVLEEIENISGRVLEGIIPKDGLEYGGWPNAEEKVPDALWRTLVADRGPDGTTAPSWYRRVCLECLHWTSASGNLNTNGIKDHTKTPATMKMFLERVQSVIWCRKFFLTKPGPGNPSTPPLFGLAPDKATRGDIICILYGCSVPVVLRELRCGRYQFIGECYVHGMMDGEALPSRLPEYPYPNGSKKKKGGFTII